MKNLIEDCKAKNKKAQDIIFEKYYEAMVMYCQRYTRDTDTAKEMAQLGFIKLFDKIDTFDHTGSFEGWLKRIMRNTAIDVIRMFERRRETLGDMYNLGRSYMEDIVDVVGEDDDQDEVYNIASESISELTPAYQKVFIMHVIEEKQHKEIAEILGISEGSSKSNLFKAKANLKTIVAKKMLEKDLHL